MEDIVQIARGHGRSFDYVGVGGGFGIDYGSGNIPDLSAFAAIQQRFSNVVKLPVALEPGRILVGNAGVLVTRVIRRKTTPAKNFVIIDGSMSELLRPALYGAKHECEWIKSKTSAKGISVGGTFEVVGPVCESSDTFGEFIFRILRKKEISY